MATEANKAVVLRLIKELYQGNLGIVDDVFAPNFAFYIPLLPNWLRGVEGARKMVVQLQSVLRDIRAMREDLFGEGDKVAVRWTFRGTYQAEAKPGNPQPGDRLTAVASGVYCFVDGKIAEDRGVEALWQQGQGWEGLAVQRDGGRGVEVCTSD